MYSSERVYLYKTSFASSAETILENLQYEKRQRVLCKFTEQII